MKQISCNVIRDLLPSYVDKIASEDSRKLVEEHLAQCPACREQKTRMEKTDLRLTGRDAGIDYMKKIRRLTDLQSAVCFLLVMTAGIFFLAYTKDLHQAKPFFVLVGVMLVCNYFLFFQNNKKKAGEKTKAWLTDAVSIFLAVYMMALMQLLINGWLNDQSLPFAIDYEKLGPFLYIQLLFIFVLEIAIWIRELVLHIRKARFSVVSSSFGIIGFYMSLYYIRMLRMMESPETFRRITDHALFLFLEGVGILVFIMITEMIRNREFKGKGGF